MAEQIAINVYGIPPRSAEQQLMDIGENNRNTFLYMEALIKAEKIRPNKEPDYDGENYIEWLKKIAISDTDVNSRIELVKILDKN